MKIISVTICSLLLIFNLSACGWMTEQPDRVTQGSLTLTPMFYPDGLVQPEADRNALSIPETIDPKDMKVMESDPVPPPIDLVKANAESKKLQPKESKQEKKSRLALESVVKQSVDGHQFLLVSGSFDHLWDNMTNLLVELGFKIEDRNRSKQTYYVYRELEKTEAQKIEEKDSGVERELGNRESYQFYLNPQDKTHTQISVRNKLGQNDDSTIAQLLLVQFKSALDQAVQ